MRRSKFDRWFREEFQRVHDSHDPTEWTGWYSYYSGRLAKHPITQAVVDDILQRLRQLECPKHSYKADSCVKCGKPRKEG